MPYRFLEDEATADVAFEAWGKELPEVFQAAADAVINVMVENPGDIRPRETKRFEVQNAQLDLLLFNFLEQLVYYKDAEHFIGNITRVEVDGAAGDWRANSDAEGEKLDPERHHLSVDVKAITLHEFTLVQKDAEWRAHVVLDI